MTARLVNLGDDVGDGIADPRDLRKTIFGDEDTQRNGEGCQAVGGSRIGLRAVGVAARKAVRCAYSRKRLATPRASSEGIQPTFRSVL